MTTKGLTRRMLSQTNSSKHGAASRMFLEAQGSGLFMPFRPLSAKGKVFCYRQNSWGPKHSHTSARPSSLVWSGCGMGPGSTLLQIIKSLEQPNYVMSGMLSKTNSLLSGEAALSL